MSSVSRGLLAEGRAALHSADPERASALLRRALELWRGPPLSVFAYESSLRPRSPGWTSGALARTRGASRGVICLGRHADWSPSWRRSSRRNQIRNGCAASDVAFIARGGKQRSNRTRRRGRTLVDEPGIEPGKALQACKPQSCSRIPRSSGAVGAPDRDATAAATAKPAGAPWRALVQRVATGRLLAAASSCSQPPSRPPPSSYGGLRRASLASVDGNWVGRRPADERDHCPDPHGRTPTSISFGEGSVRAPTRTTRRSANRSPDKGVEIFGWERCQGPCSRRRGGVGRKRKEAAELDQSRDRYNDLVARPGTGDSRARSASEAEGGIQNPSGSHRRRRRSRLGDQPGFHGLADRSSNRPGRQGRTRHRPRNRGGRAIRLPPEQREHPSGASTAPEPVDEADPASRRRRRRDIAVGGGAAWG